MNETLYVDIWSWFDGFEREATLKGDTARQRLPGLFKEARLKFEAANDETFSLLTQGRDLAEMLNEPCWLLFYEHWRCEVLLFYKVDLAQGMDLAVHNTVEVRKPQYQHCPVRAQVFFTLVDAYMFCDPVGYANQIRQTLDYLENEVPLDIDTWRMIESRRSGLALEFDDLTEAQAAALRYLDRSDNDNFRLRGAYDLLTEIAYKCGNYDEALKYAQSGETVSRRVNNSRRILTSFILWQALMMRKLGNEDEAHRLYNAAMLRIERGESDLGRYCYNIICEYHEAGGTLEQALHYRQEQLTAMTAAQSWHEISECRRKLCRIRALMGLPFEEDLTVVRDLANHLVNPSRLLAKLDRIVQGDYADGF